MIHLLSSNASGQPLVAICTDCEHDSETVWVRPADDPAAATLASWMRAHRRKSGPHELVPPEVVAAAKSMFAAAGGAGNLGATSPTVPGPTNENYLFTVG